MPADRNAPDPTAPVTIDPPPLRPPLELVESGDKWVLEAYNQGLRDGETYAIYDRQMDAMRAGKKRMDEHGHPCLLRWESEDSVGTIYWTPQYERLVVCYDDMLDTWVVLPEDSHAPMYLNDRQELATRQAHRIQHAYNFKHLALHRTDGSKEREIDHRFIRNGLERSGVTFNRQAVADAKINPLAEETEEENSAQPTAATPTSALAAAVPNLSDIEVLFSNEAIHRYRAGWTDDSVAFIDILDPDRCDDRDLVDAFLSIVESWETLGDSQGVSEVYDDGVGPSPWVAYAAGDGALVDTVDTLSLTERLRIGDHITSAYHTAILYNVTPRGARPENVFLRNVRGHWQGELADWGLSNAVARVNEAEILTNYTPPEMLVDERNDRTPVYQLGALLYYLVAKRPPYSGVANLKSAIERGDPTPPSKVTGGPDKLDDIILKAMAPNPGDRFERIKDFQTAISEFVE